MGALYATNANDGGGETTKRQKAKRMQPPPPPPPPPPADEESSPLNRMPTASSTELKNPPPIPTRCRRFLQCVGGTLFGTFVFVVVVTLFVLLFKANAPKISGWITTPSMGEWSYLVRCADDAEAAMCDLCHIPLMLSLVPPNGKVAVVAPPGTGSDELILLVEEGTRIYGGRETCLMPHTEGTVWNAADVVYRRNCFDDASLGHLSLVHFWDAARVGFVPGYKPTHLIFLVRNPFDAILDAYTQLQKCAAPSAVCSVLPPKEVNFGTFAHQLADVLGRHRRTANQAQAGGGGVADIVLDYDSLSDLDTFAKVVDWMRPAFTVLPSTQRVAACATVALPRPTFRGEAYARAWSDPELVKRVCAALGDGGWDSRWGKTCAA